LIYIIVGLATIDITHSLDLVSLDLIFLLHLLFLFHLLFHINVLPLDSLSSFP
jgi:hypothetical protein